MDYNLITPNPLQPGWGLIYQGGTVDADIRKFPNPTGIICMDIGEQNEIWIDHSGPVQLVLSVWINDSPDSTLPDITLIRTAEVCKVLLAQGINLYIHCAAGVSRSSYMTCATLMRIRGISFDAALAIIRTARPQANPNSGFVDQLRRLESQLHGATSP